MSKDNPDFTVLLVLSIFVFEVYSSAADRVDLHSSFLYTSVYSQLSSELESR